MGDDVLSSLRSAVVPLKQALARPLAALGLPPNLLTLAAIPLALGAAWLVALDRPLVGLLLAVPASLVDFIDGEVARLQGRSSAFGNLLEAIVDRVVEGLLLASLVPFFPLAAAASLGLGFLVSYVKARTGLVVAADNRDWPGWGDHSDRILLALVAILLWGLGLRLGGVFAAEGALWLLAALSLVGVLQRLRYSRELIREAERSGDLLAYLK